VKHHRSTPMKPNYDALMVMVTPAQRRIVGLCIEGLDYARIAFQLKWTTQAVREQLRFARINTGCKNDCQLAVLLMKAGVPTAPQDLYVRTQISSKKECGGIKNGPSKLTMTQI
jgi:hypothetical protein